MQFRRNPGYTIRKGEGSFTCQILARSLIINFPRSFRQEFLLSPSYNQSVTFEEYRSSISPFRSRGSLVVYPMDFSDLYSSMLPAQKDGFDDPDPIFVSGEGAR